MYTSISETRQGVYDHIGLGYLCVCFISEWYDFVEVMISMAKLHHVIRTKYKTQQQYKGSIQ